MKDLLLGVDGGGTKGHVAVFGFDGSCKAALAYGPLNHEGMDGSFAELEIRLGDAVHEALRLAGGGTRNVARAVFGLAGVDNAAQHQTISGIIERIGLSDFTLCNDAFLGVMAGCPDGVGICAINGTGSTIAGIDRTGEAVQVSGLGDLTDDRGGGDYYAMQAVAAVYRELYKNGRVTALREMVFHALGITRKEDYVEALTNGALEKAVDALNRLVFEAADAGDGEALFILLRSSEHFTGSIVHLARSLDFPFGKPLHVTLAGSVFVKERRHLLPKMVEESVREELHGREVEFVMLDVPPVAGAILCASREAGAGVTGEDVRTGLAGKL
jgi:N-acetylglucosamine kinase-like BadF-type ATPase